VLKKKHFRAKCPQIGQRRVRRPLSGDNPIVACLFEPSEEVLRKKAEASLGPSMP
jgi:hypothetical protein